MKFSNHFQRKIKIFITRKGHGPAFSFVSSQPASVFNPIYHLFTDIKKNISYICWQKN